MINNHAKPPARASSHRAAQRAGPVGQADTAQRGKIPRRPASQYEPRDRAQGADQLQVAAKGGEPCPHGRAEPAGALVHRDDTGPIRAPVPTRRRSRRTSGQR
jgi:hypothetical protein